MTDPYGVEQPPPVPSTPEPESAPAPEAVAETVTTDGADQSGAAGRRRGRPRPEITLDRDRAVLSKINEYCEGVSRARLAEELGMPPSLTYLALYRLSRSGQIEKVSNADARFAWRLTDLGRTTLAPN